MESDPLSSDSYMLTTHKNSLEYHMKTNAVEKTTVMKKSFSCEVCQRSYTRKSAFLRHTRTHEAGEKRFACTICQHSTTRKADLKLHMWTHSDKKPFACDVCNYSTASKRDFACHTQTHTGDKKPFKCDSCGYSTTLKRSLVSHQKTHSTEKPYICDICQLATSRKSDLIRHKKTHSGEKPFSCAMCQYSTARRTDLKNHMKVHSKGKPFHCHNCRFSSAHKSTEEHLGKKYFCCSICSYSFQKESCFLYHLKRHSIEEPTNSIVSQSKLSLSSAGSNITSYTNGTDTSKTGVIFPNEYDDELQNGEIDEVEKNSLNLPFEKCDAERNLILKKVVKEEPGDASLQRWTVVEAE